MKLILTCEHGGNQIPPAYKTYFKECKYILNSHRGYDLGALDAFKYLQTLCDFSIHSKTSRLLVELNRSLHHQNIFSEVSKQFSTKQKAQILARYYFPYRDQVQHAIEEAINNNQSVVHISIHSFTPILNNNLRNCDVGILYDSQQQHERLFANELKSAIKSLNPSLKLRFNYPYLGKMDGFTTYLRKRFQYNYVGIELEISQKFATNNKIHPSLKSCFFHAIDKCMKNQQWQ